MYQKFKDFQFTVVAVIIAFALMASTYVAANSIKKDGIADTGSAYKIVKSDTGILKLEIKSKNPNKAVAYAAIKKQIPMVKNYLLKSGFSDKEISVMSANSYTTMKTNQQTGYTTNVIDYYNFEQVIEVKSNNVEKIKEVSLNAQSLLDKGIDLNINAPEYYYSKLGEIKVELLKEASKDAKQRATGMLSATNNSVGKIRSVQMGVFQITPADSTEVSDYGVNDTTSVEKKVTAVANVTFGIR